MRKFYETMKSEFKAITWPTWRELVELLLFTIIVCGIIAVLMLGLDIVFLRIRDILLEL